MDIVHKSVVTLVSNVDIAAQHRIRPILVSNLVCKLKRNHKAFEEMELKLAEKAASDQLIHDATEYHLKNHRHIWNAAQIRDQVRLNSGKQANIQRIRKILRSHYGFRYKKIQNIAF